MTPAGVKYVIMSDSCNSQVFQCMTLAGVKCINMYDSCRSQVSPCMTPEESSMSVSMTTTGAICQYV